MREEKRFELGPLVEKAVGDVFETMLSLKTVRFLPSTPPKLNGDHMVGSVGFAGKATGLISIQLETDFACFLTARLLGMESDEPVGFEEVKDVLGEMSNMIGGSMKSRLCDAGFSCALSIPSVTYGSDFKTSSAKGGLQEKFFFRHRDDILRVEVVMKA